MLRHQRVLVLAAHPDDEILGVGGTIPLLIQAGSHVSVAIATDGSSTQYPGDDDRHDRKRCALLEANKVVGTAEVIELGFPDMRLDSVPHAELNAALTNLLLHGAYDCVFVHHPHDINRDHKVLFQSLLVAARPLASQVVQTILSYHVNSSTEWGARSPSAVFCPNIYVDIGTTIDTKIRALECYDLELRPYPHPRSSSAVRDRARVFGTEAGFFYAEAFSLVLGRSSLSASSTQKVPSLVIQEAGEGNE